MPAQPTDYTYIMPKTSFPSDVHKSCQEELVKFMAGRGNATRLACAKQWKELHPNDTRIAESIACTVKCYNQQPKGVHSNSKLSEEQEQLYLCSVLSFFAC